MKGICLTFNLVPRLVVYDKYQLRYDLICMYNPTRKNCIKVAMVTMQFRIAQMCLFFKTLFLIHLVPRNNLAPMQNIPEDAR